MRFDPELVVAAGWMVLAAAVGILCSVWLMKMLFFS
jgi:hypothetical protein